MVLQKIKYCLVALVIVTISCTHEPALPGLVDSGYPQNIGNIMLTKCAISGCHNDKSYINAAGLNLTTWEGMFRGTIAGATTIPYRPDFSSICYFTNRDTNLGIISGPLMPVGIQPLTKDEYLQLRDWIANGAPNKTGKVKFSDNPQRSKIYVTNRVCNVVTVLDEQTFLQMRYVNVGGNANAAFPMCVHVSPDKKYWYVSFFTQTNIVQKFRADNDDLVGNMDIGTGAWNSFTITTNSKYGFFADNSDPGKIVYVDLENMKVLATYNFSGNFQYLTGITLNESLKKLYIGTANGNYIYNIDITDPLHPDIHEIPIDGSSTVQHAPILNPIELITDTATNLCYIACEHSNEIRVVDMTNNKLKAIIPLGSNPAFMAVSNIHSKLFVTCPDDMNTFPGNRGALVVIDLQTNNIIKRINIGYQPYGISVNEKQNTVAIVNANISGPKTHHVSGCGQKLGNLSFIDLSTLNILNDKQRELAVYPFAIANR